MPLNIPRPRTPHTNVYSHQAEITPIVPGLYLSSLRAASNIDSLKALRITRIVSILDYPVYFQGWSGEQLIVKVADRPETDLLARFEQCVGFIDRAIQGGGNVLVHCKEGLSRSVTIVAAYLIARYRMSARDALRLIGGKRRTINPNEGFVFQLAEYERMMLRGERPHRASSFSYWIARLAGRTR